MAPGSDCLGVIRASYDTVAVDYAELLESAHVDSPWERAVLATFAELVLRAGGGPVVDLGCGPGRLTGYLASLGLSVSGIDLSPGMVAEARRRHPELRFDEGSMTALALPDGGLAGLVTWYSIIHLPPELLPGVFAEQHRVLAPGGHLVLGIKVGDDAVHLSHAYGHPLSLDVYRLRPEHVADLLREAGFEVRAELRREPEGAENTPQAYLFARKPGEAPAPES
ncbi:MAG TPA: methyltransferase domain-containing protein [Pseudonocardia sp.]|nr:methyltransferase domain-containing protein [Pseudonocardia sp.]